MSEVLKIEKNKELDYLVIFGLPGPTSREIKFVLDDNAKLNFKAIVLGGEKDEFNLDLVMQHVGKGAISNADIRAVMGGSSKAKLNGLIRIEQTGSQTQAFLEERALLLSDNARVQTIPQLEIETDDVQATHAAAVSRLSDEHLFYLQARGMPLSQARQLIIYSFLLGNTDEDKISGLREKLHNVLADAEY